MINRVLKRILKQYGIVIGTSLLILTFVYLFLVLIVNITNNSLENSELSVYNIVEEDKIETKKPISKEYISPYRDVRKAIANTLLLKENGESAVYEIEYIVTWSRDTHPQWYPTAASSSLVLWTHPIGENKIYTEKELASSALETFTERNNESPLKKIFETLASTKNVSSYIFEKNIKAPGIFRTQIAIEKVSPSISAIATLIQSPDWVATAHSIPLYNSESGWIGNIEIPLTLYDIGTDSGTSFFESRNIETPIGSERIVLQKPEIKPDIGLIRITLLGNK